MRQGAAEYKGGAQEGGNRNGAFAAIGTNVAGGAERQGEDHHGFATVSVSLVILSLKTQPVNSFRIIPISEP